MARDRSKLRDLVPHPRFGTESVRSGHAVAFEDLDHCWRSRRETIFLESVLPADTSRQNYVAVPRRFYVDVLKECRKCHRRFIFFAREQKFWFEELHFYIDADCIHCPKCRRDEHQMRAAIERYSRNAKRREMNDDELARHVDDLCVLFEAGILKNVEKASWAVSAARKRLDPKRIERMMRCLSEAGKH